MGIIPYRNKEIAQKNEADKAFRAMPTASILITMEYMLNVLKDRGVEVRDFDNKDKVVEQIRLIGGKAYFLAAGKSTEAYKDALQLERENVTKLSKILMVKQKRIKDLEMELERVRDGRRSN